MRRVEVNQNVCEYSNFMVVLPSTSLPLNLIPSLFASPNSLSNIDNSVSMVTA